jgi:hypothetical protein
VAAVAVITAAAAAATTRARPLQTLAERVRVRLDFSRRWFASPLIREGAAAPLFFLPEHGVIRSLDGWNLLVFHDGNERYLPVVDARIAMLTSLGCTPYAIGRRRAESPVSFPRLGDDGEVARAYGAWADVPVFGGRIVPSVVLVNPMRKVRLANRGTPSVDAIVRTIQALQQATRARM